MDCDVLLGVNESVVCHTPRTMSVRVLTKAVVVALSLLVVLHFGSRERPSSSRVNTVAFGAVAAGDTTTTTTTLATTSLVDNNGNASTATTTMNASSNETNCDHPPDDAAEACRYVQRSECEDESEFVDYLYIHYVRDKTKCTV